MADFFSIPKAHRPKADQWNSKQTNGTEIIKYG
jgi:hypothetical protein